VCDVADDMGQAPEEKDATALPRDLRFLKILVTVLTVAMIAGVITITALLVIRLNAAPQTVTIAPGEYAPPDGVGIVGFSVIDGRAVVIGDDGVIRVHDRASGAVLQTFDLGE